MEKKVYDLVIDSELEQVAPPLKKCELDMLEKDIIENGCRDPLAIWNGVIVDGHNRYRICQEHNIPFAVEEINFDDKTQAKVWIAKNQLARRNLTPFQKCEMVLPLEAPLKEDADRRRRRLISEFRKNGTTSGGYQKTRDILADMAGVSHNTLQKAKNILEAGDEETKRRVRAGEISIHFAYRSLKNTMDVHGLQQETDGSGTINNPDVYIVQQEIDQYPIDDGQNAISPQIDDALYFIDALIEDLRTKELDKETVISLLTDISGMLGGKYGKEAI